MTDAAMKVPPRALPRVVCSCCYALLVTDVFERDAELAWHKWLETVQPEPGEEPETARLRADLLEIGVEEFRRDWEHLVAVMDATSPEALRECLGELLEPAVEQGLARRAWRNRQRGQA